MVVVLVLCSKVGVVLCGVVYIQNSCMGILMSGSPVVV